MNWFAIKWGPGGNYPSASWPPIRPTDRVTFPLRGERGAGTSVGRIPYLNVRS